MQAVLNILTVKSMVSPLVLQFLFWTGIGGTLYGAYVLIKLENWAWIFAVTIGPLLVHVIFERAIIAFRTFDRLGAIQHELAILNERDR